MTAPRVSVVMIFLNAERFIADSIASVTGQTISAWELLLVDDGSSDASTAIARGAAEASGGRIRYLEHPEHANRGMAETRNLGLREATGEYLLYLDSDDILVPDALERLAAPLDRDRAVAVSCAATLFWNWDPAIEREPDKMQRFREWADRTVGGRLFLAAMIADEDLHPANCSTLFRREAVLAIGGFDLAFRGMYEDTALLTEVLVRHRVHVASACLSAYRMHLNSFCHTAASAGDYAADRANAARDRFVNWAETYVQQKGALDGPMREAIATARRPDRPRSPVRRLWSALRHPRKLASRLRPVVADTAAMLRVLDAFHRRRGDVVEAERLAARAATLGEKAVAGTKQVVLGAAIGLGLTTAVIGAMLPRGNQAPPRPATVTDPADQPKPPPGYKMTPSFSDEFDEPMLDVGRWNNVFDDRNAAVHHLPKRNIYSSAEMQVYFDPDYLGLGINPFSIGDGILRITARPLSEPERQAVLADLRNAPPDQQRSALRNVRYSSGLISTRGGWTQKYGYFEVRARWSAGKGLWPQIWLLPKGGGWPPEIDILEAHGDKPRTAFQSIHSSLPPKAVTRTVQVDGTAQTFHRYGVLWLPDRVDYYIDGRRTSTIPAPADMTVPMYILVNLAIGGNWPGNPDASTTFPATMDVDYVKAWRFVGPPPAPQPSAPPPAATQ